MNAIAKVQSGAVAQYTPDQIDLIKRTICKGGTDDETQTECCSDNSEIANAFFGSAHVGKVGIGGGDAGMVSRTVKSWACRFPLTASGL